MNKKSKKIIGMFFVKKDLIFLKNPYDSTLQLKRSLIKRSQKTRNHNNVYKIWI